MKNINEYITESVRNNQFQLVGTRGGFGFLFGTLKRPMVNAEVEAIAKEMHWKVQDFSEAFGGTDMDGVLPCAVFEIGENEIIWYDANDGTVYLVK